MTPTKKIQAYKIAKSSSKIWLNMDSWYHLVKKSHFTLQMASTQTLYF